MVIQSFPLMFQDPSVDLEDCTTKNKHQDNPFIEPVQQQTVVDMKGDLII